MQNANLERWVMFNVDTLKWEIRGNETYAMPRDVRWSYHIKPVKDKFELTLNDNHNKWAAAVSTLYNSLVEAQEQAVRHYFSVISSNVMIFC